MTESNPSKTRQVYLSRKRCGSATGLNPRHFFNILEGFLPTAAFPYCLTGKQAGASALMMYIIQFVENRESDRPVQIGTTYQASSAGDAAGLARVLIRNSELPKPGGFIIYDDTGKEIRRQYLDEQCDPPVP
jgi:hypothetical protein